MQPQPLGPPQQAMAGRMYHATVGASGGLTTAPCEGAASVTMRVAAAVIPLYIRVFHHPLPRRMSGVIPFSGVAVFSIGLLCFLSFGLDTHTVVSYEYVFLDENRCVSVRFEFSF